jgi:hypothetical protein
VDGPSARARPGARPSGRGAPGPRPLGIGGDPTSPTGNGNGPRGITRPTATRGTTCPTKHARSRTYRWAEDGLLGNLRRSRPALLRRSALWNEGRPDLKERLFGLTVRSRATTVKTSRKPTWYLDATPTHFLSAGPLPLSTGRFSVCGPGQRKRAPDPSRSRVRYSAIQGVFRRKPLLRCRGRIRQGRRPKDILIRAVGDEPRRPRGARCISLPTIWFQEHVGMGPRRRPP